MLQKSFLVSISLWLFFGIHANGQKRKQIEYSGFFDSYYYRGPLNIHIGGTAAGYAGDLGFMPNFSIAPGFNVGGSYMVWPRTYFGLDFNYLKINGLKRDTSGYTSFNNTLYELIAFCRFNLVDKRILFKNDINKRPPRIRPYITLGIGAIYHDPVLAVTDSNFFKTYYPVKSNIAFVLPASLGFAFYISKRFSVLAEVGYRYTFADGLDGLNKLGASSKDSYMTASLKLQYSIHPFKRKRAKYIPPAEGGGGGSGGNQAPIKKDSTLNDPILPPGQVAPPASDSLSAPIAPSEGQAPVEAPKELSEEEKAKELKRKQEEEEQKQWEQGGGGWGEPAAKPAEKKKSTTTPAKKKTTQQDTGGW